MGQRHSKVTDSGDDVKRQIGSDDGEQPFIYQLLNVKDGGGKLIDLINESRGSSCYALSESSGEGETGLTRQLADKYLDERICGYVRPLLYNDGEGQLMPLSRISLVRFGCSASQLRELDEDSYRAISKSISLTDEDNIEACEEEEEEEEVRLVCWRLDERGAVGETALHICFLLSTKTHMELAHRLLRLFPKLINDIYMKDVYFGESSLHMSIVNEDITILKTLLDYGANVHERCLGVYFVCEDQKNKVNVQEKKLVDQVKFALKTKQYAQLKQLKNQIAQLNWSSNTFGTNSTSYESHCYWGEYPLSFAVCLNLEHCFRLLLAKGANPNCQDSNGNTSLHMAVIFDKISMFDLCFSSGGDMRVKNKQKLTPLTLAAKLGRTEMFFHILEVQRIVNWIFCNVGFVDFPLDEIDSINTLTGASVEESALSIVVFSSSNEHLKMLDGFLSQLLTVKWETTQKSKFFSMLCHFTIIFLVSIVSYMTRHMQQQQLQFKTVNQIQNNNSTKTTQINDKSASTVDAYLVYVNIASEVLLILLIVLYLQSAFFRTLSGNSSSDDETSNSDKLSSLDLLIKTVTLSPEMSLFVLTSLMIMVSIPLRVVYSDSKNYFAKLADDSLSAFIMFALPLKFLFFCRAFRSVGPFVIMIYKIVVNDLLCFVIIMLIFVFGFSQSFAIIFKSHSPAVAVRQLPTDSSQPQLTSNYFENFFDGLLSMHLMALNEFGMVFDEFEQTNFPRIAKSLFLVYMILVSILLVNLLIAMLGKTYQEIASQPNENLRQWARTLLMVEKSWRDCDRLASLKRYSEEKTVRAIKANQAGQMQSIDLQSRFYKTTWTLNSSDRIRVESLKKMCVENEKNAQKLLSIQKRKFVHKRKKKVYDKLDRRAPAGQGTRRPV